VHEALVLFELVLRLASLTLRQPRGRVPQRQVSSDRANPVGGVGNTGKEFNCRLRTFAHLLTFAIHSGGDELSALMM
jgi:hypothetical protein